MAGYNYTVNAGRNIPHYIGKSSYLLPDGNIPEGTDLYQYDTDVILFYDSEVGGWYSKSANQWYQPGTVMEPMTV